MSKSLESGRPSALGFSQAWLAIKQTAGLVDSWYVFPKHNRSSLSLVISDPRTDNFAKGVLLTLSDNKTYLFNISVNDSNVTYICLPFLVIDSLFSSPPLISTGNLKKV